MLLMKGSEHIRKFVEERYITAHFKILKPLKSTIALRVLTE
jgi:hypothetical protein